jgi:hypothetical protein
MRRFSSEDLQLVRGAGAEAQRLVTGYYAIAPREWALMRYEVRTQVELEPTELNDSVLAHMVCYEYTRRVGCEILERGDLYRICLQDNRILSTLTQTAELDLSRLLIYVLTHELVHVVRFGQRLQRLDLPADERPREEQSVEMITERILGYAPGSEATRKLRELPKCRELTRSARNSTDFGTFTSHSRA